MRNAVNIFNKINFRAICTLVAVLFVFSAGNVSAADCGKQGVTCGAGQKCIRCVSISSNGFQSYSTSTIENFQCIDAEKNAEDYSSTFAGKKDVVMHPMAVTIKVESAVPPDIRQLCRKTPAKIPACPNVIIKHYGNVRCADCLKSHSTPRAKWPITLLTHSPALFYKW